MKSILLLTFNKEDDNNVTLRKMNNVEGVTALPVLKNLNIILKCIRKIDMLLPYPIFLQLWLTAGAKKELDKYDAIICMASAWSSKILEYLNRKHKYTCINYFWDKISISNYPIKKSKLYKNWSFNQEDSCEYGMKYNPQFYVNDINLPDNIDCDVTFVGSDRSGMWSKRTQFILESYKNLISSGCKVCFWYVTSDKTEEFMHTKTLDMSDYLKTISKGKAILEIVQPGEEWITERVFLALRNKRKLITNNKKIVDEDFYCKDNIFILGSDNLDEIQLFLNKKFNDSIDLSYYSMQQWKERFFEI